MPMRPGQAKAPATSAGTSGGGALVPGNFANPSAQVGLSAVNGSALTAMRSDGAPALSVSITPTWTNLHTFNAGMSVPDTMGINSLLAPPTPPPNCTTGFDYYYDAPTYVNTALWTPSVGTPGTFVVVRGTPSYYGVAVSPYINTSLSNTYTMTCISTAWVTISFDYNVLANGRGAYGGTLASANGFILLTTNIYVKYAILVSAGNLILRQTVRDQSSSVTTTDTTLGSIVGTYNVNRTIKISRATPTSSNVTVSVNGVNVLTNEPSGLAGSCAFSVSGAYTTLGDYPGGQNNAAETDTKFRNIEIIGTALGTSCTIGASTQRGLISRNGRDVLIGSASDWDRIALTVPSTGKIEYIGGTTSIYEISLNGALHKVPVTNQGFSTMAGLSNFGSGGISLPSLVSIFGTAPLWAGDTVYGLSVRPVFPNTAITEGTAIYAQARTAITSFVYPMLKGMYIDTPFLGSGATATAFIGLDIEGQFGATTTNLAIRTGLSGGIQFQVLTASQAVFTNGSKTLVSNAITGTGNVVMSASPTLTGTIGAASMTLSASLTVGTTLGVTGVATFTAAPIFSSMPINNIMAVDGSKQLVAAPTTGTLGSVVLSVSPTFTGTVSMAGLILSAAPRLNFGNTTGGGTALLGANSPAVTNSAPYTWMTALSSDGSTVYIPVWK